MRASPWRRGEWAGAVTPVKYSGWTQDTDYVLLLASSLSSLHIHWATEKVGKQNTGEFDTETITHHTTRYRHIVIT